MEGEIAIGTRFWSKNPDRAKDIENFVERAKACVKQVFVAVNTEEDEIGTIKNENLNIPGVSVFGVTPWGKFVPALNAIVIKATLAGAKMLLLASVEINILPEHLLQLKGNMDSTTLVVGAALPGHDLKKGEQIGNGITTPWNTLSLWNLKYLSRIGFPLIGDALFYQKCAGIEEVSTIAVFQRIYPFLKAKLVEIPGIEWNIDHFDSERMEKHLQKMESKFERAELQMQILALPSPLIIHIHF